MDAQDTLNNKFKALDLIFRHSHNTGASLDESYDELSRMYRKVFPTDIDKKNSTRDKQVLMNR